MFKRLHVLATLAAVAFFTFSGAAFADQPKPWQIGFQDAASPVMEKITEFHDLLLIIITGIVLFVLALMIYVIVKFNEKANPVPSTTSHNTMLEVIWTAVPILILVLIASPSIKLLYFMDKNPNAEMTLKVTGHQWYWSYQYPDNGDFEFDSYIVDDDDLKEGQPRLLAVDNEVVLPVDTDIRILLASDDVIHNWAMPSFGIKIDTVPGRTNETWVRIDKEGTYYGQCSELCGVNHGFMPIAVKAVSKEAFKAWTVEAQKEFAKADDSSPRIAFVNDVKAALTAR
ncbi:MAG: cytochrome c oxidase subunit II [Rhodospirillaceae bacterium]|nr:cytochrome c oxidase subunit II [Rhodospirillaceae bacterium]MBT4219261.1 cytochrome c oxidase subunit II [Rhodospirillaceae bacterium]MBT4463546.1 cytochrome c oxidase subunit II [Rhodospirillaceae bacterium]MBT5014664.1 cytochrome c oxidase subunit II [Rhodospirillaceae bacterium]MBT5308482.1 cytochrome c oxidase subunit II [Rhodospirillaceae bacterium]